NTVDLNGAASLFLQGKAAIYYSGSWSLRDFNDPAQNRIGADAIGFFNVPLVPGGKGTLDDWMLNAGLATSFSAAAFDDTMKDWMKNVFGEYGNKATSQMGFLTGFQVEETTAALPPLTQMVQRKLDEVKNGVLWFEALFGPEAQTVAW